MHRNAINSHFVVRYTAAAEAAFARAHPDIEVHVTSSFEPPNIIAEGYDIALQFGHLSDSTLIAKRLGHHDLGLCASPEYFEAHGAPESVDDLRPPSCLAGRAGCWHFDMPTGSSRLKVEAGRPSEQ